MILILPRGIPVQISSLVTDHVSPLLSACPTGAIGRNNGNYCNQFGSFCPNGIYQGNPASVPVEKVDGSREFETLINM